MILRELSISQFDSLPVGTKFQINANELRKSGWTYLKVKNLKEVGFIIIKNDHNTDVSCIKSDYPLMSDEKLLVNEDQ